MLTIIPDGFGIPYEQKQWLCIMEMELHFVQKIMQKILVIAKSFVSWIYFLFFSMIFGVLENYFVTKFDRRW